MSLVARLLGALSLIAFGVSAASAQMVLDRGTATDPSTLDPQIRVLVFGGTGRLGAEVVKELVKADEQVVVFARTDSDRWRLEGLPVNYVIGDALVDADVEAAFKSQKFRVAINALSQRGNENNESFYERAQKLITKWAKATGVNRVILHSSVGAGDSRAIYPRNTLAARGEVLRDKEAAENDLIASGVGYTIIRNYRLRYDPIDPKFEGTAYLTDDTTIAGGISRADLAVLMMPCLDGPQCENKIFHALRRRAHSESGASSGLAAVMDHGVCGLGKKQPSL